MRPRPLIALTAYVSTVLLANWLVQRFGIVDLTPGPATLMAPAGVYAIGLGLVARDVVHELGGWRLALAGIAVGTVLSVLVADPRLVVASGAAFLISELLDFGVYSRLRKRGWTLAAVTSSALGAGVDSLVFLTVAFGSLQFLPGQWLGKLAAIAIAVAVLAPLRGRWAR